MRPAAKRAVPLAVGVLYAGALVLAGWQWVAEIRCAIPDAARLGNAGWGADARLKVYILAWVSRALRAGAAHLFDPPIGYPAPGALTGSEHLLGAQPVFMPLDVLTGNFVLAASVTALVSYWASGMATYALLRVHGLPRLGSIAGGFLAMFGPLQVPADVHIVQFAAWGVPLVLLTAEQVRRRPRAGPTIVLAAALTLAALSAYQVAANVFLVAGVLVLCSIGTTRTLRHPRTLAYGIATATAAVVVAAASSAYIERLRDPGMRTIAHMTMGPDASAIMRGVMAAYIERYVVAVALVGTIAAVAMRRFVGLACLGVALAIAGVVVASGWNVEIGGVVVPLPYALIAKLPGSTAVGPTRYLLLATTGFAILGGCAVGVLEDVLRGRLGPASSVARATTAAVVAALAVRGMTSFTPPPVTCLSVATDVPRVYRWLSTTPGGTVLDLRGAHPYHLGLPVDLSAAMLASLVHGHPLIGLHTHHTPPGTELVAGIASTAPTEARLQALVDMAHLQWIVLPPGDARADAWMRLAGVGEAASFDDGRVLEVRRSPRFEWFAALSHGPRAGESLLGTPSSPVVDPRVDVAIAAYRRVLEPAGKFIVHVRARNVGSHAWPVAFGFGADDTLAVRLTFEWIGSTQPADTVAFPYDVEPGETMELDAWVSAPPTPGRYALRAAVTQGGRRFEAASAPVDVEVRHPQ